MIYHSIHWTLLSMDLSRAPGDLLSWTCAPQYPRITEMSHGHWCRDAKPCDLPEIEQALEMGSLMETEGLEPVPDASDPWLTATGNWSTPLILMRHFWNARAWTRWQRSTLQQSVALLEHKRHVGDLEWNPIEQDRMTIRLNIDC